MRHATPGFTIEGIIANFLFIFVLPFDFCRFCVVIRFFHPSHNGQWPLTSKDFYTRFYSLHYFLILILEKEPVFPFSMLSAKQGNHWYHFYNVFGMTRSLTGDWTRDLPHDASTIPLDYRGGGIANMNVKNNWLKYLHLPETVYCMLYRKTAHCVPQSPLHHTRYSRAFLFRLVIWKLYQKQVIRSLSVKWKIKIWVIYTNIYITNFRSLHKVS